MSKNQRIKKVQDLLRRKQWDAVIVVSTPNFYYFTGAWINSLERLEAVVIPLEGRPTVIAHQMSEQKIAFVNYDKVFWKDGDNPIEILAKLLPEKIATISVDNGCPSSFLIDLMSLKKDLHFVKSNEILEPLRMIKDQSEISLLKEAGAVAFRVMSQLTQMALPGISESQLAEEIHRLFKKEGVDQLSFKPVVASGKNSSIPHHRPGDRILHEGDSVILDLGGVNQFYCSDITRTIAIGKPSQKFEEVYDVVRRAQNKAIESIKPGVSIQSIDQAARSVIEDAGYGPNFVHRTGHGIGIDLHEAPFVNTTNEQIIQEGMVMSVEPGIYIEGQFGVRVEDVVVVTSKGAERITTIPRASESFESCSS